MHNYPLEPGFKARDTSAAAADAIASPARTLRDAVLKRLRFIYPAGLTADESADYLNESILSIRPRLSELATSNLIRDTGFRRKNTSGRQAIVWMAIMPQKQLGLFDGQKGEEALHKSGGGAS